MAASERYTANPPPEFVLQRMRKYKASRSRALHLSQDVVMSFHTTPNRSLVWGEKGVMKSKLLAFLLAGQTKIGAIHADLYTVKQCRNNEHFWDLMDYSSAYEEELARTICTFWDDVGGDIGCEGPILHFGFAWISKDWAGCDLLELAGRAIMESVWPTHSLILLKAWPFEYKLSEISKYPALMDARSNRVNAMVRHYSRIFGVQPFTGQEGRDGWMWAVNPNRCVPAPVRFSRPPDFMNFVSRA